MAVHQPGDVVRDLRMRVGLTQDALAARAGVSRETISMLETGRSLGRSYLVRAALARGFGLAVEDIARIFDAPASTLADRLARKIEDRARPRA